MFGYQKILQPSRTASSENDHNASVDSRKSNKPLLEKKRRARINRSLEQLKALLIDTIKSDHTTGYSKLEKADILELAVKYLRNVRTQQMTGVSVVDPKAVTARYQAGFKECATEVDRYLSSVDGLSPDARGRLMSHLAACVRHRQLSPTSAAVPPTTYVPPSLMASSFHQQSPMSGRPFGHFDVGMTSSPYVVAAAAATTPFVGAATSQCHGASAATARLQHVATPTYDSTPERWTPSVCGSETASTTTTPMDDSGTYSGGQTSERSRRSSSVMNDVHDDEDDVDDKEGVTSTWNIHVACRDGRLTRPLAEKNNNVDNIARNVVQYQSSQHEQTQNVFLIKTADEHLLLDDAVKDEPVWRPW